MILNVDADFWLHVLFVKRTTGQHFVIIIINLC